MFSSGFYYCDSCNEVIFHPTANEKRGVGVTINAYDFNNDMDIGTETLTLCYDCYKSLCEYLKTMRG